MQAKARLRLVAPTHQNRTMPLRPANADLLIKAARKSGKTEAQAQRDATLVLVAYRHGLRACTISGQSTSEISARSSRYWALCSFIERLRASPATPSHARRRGTAILNGIKSKTSRALAKFLQISKTSSQSSECCELIHSISS
jgi:hypothetical protein